MLACVPINRRRRCGGPPDGGRGGVGCRVRHAPLKARDASETGAPKHWEYMDTLNNPLMFGVFIPIFFPHHGTLHESPRGVAENLHMIRPCAAIAETEGTCPGDGRTGAG
jgi:hypothetical protein